LNKPKSSKKETVKKTIFCPRCGSTNIFWASGLPQFWSIWECRDCGYRGAFIVEDSKLASKIREEYIKKKIGQDSAKKP